MKHGYSKTIGAFAFAAPHVKMMCGAGLPLILMMVLYILSKAFECVSISGIETVADLQQKCLHTISVLMSISAIVSAVLLMVAFVFLLFTPDTIRMKYMIRKALYHPKYGNPLKLKEGDVMPYITVKQSKNNNACYEIKIETMGCNVDTLSKIIADINAALGGRFKNFTVVSLEQDTAGNHVTYVIADVQSSKKLTCHSLKDLSTKEKNLIRVDKETCLDLRHSGSMLFAGKTRSGKTTGIISLLMQILKLGRDDFGSLVTIIDPKRAELSVLEHVCSPDKDGDMSRCMQAIEIFLTRMSERQQELNRLSKKSGNAVRWWEAGMHPSFLFIDEFVAMCSMLPKKAPKDKCCLENFNSLIKQIATMGSSAGCYVIISIAEASVGEGGIPSMLKAAMGTKVLFRPTLNEAKLLWENSDMLKALPERNYGAGDAWFSSTDGVHDNVSFVQFPELKFGEYAELNRLLKEYYND